MEESGEVIDAIDNDDDENLCEELGDVLLQVVMHAQIAAERGSFTIDDVVQGVSEKMIRRHPHVFGNVKVSSPEERIVEKNQRTGKVRLCEIKDLSRQSPARSRPKPGGRSSGDIFYRLYRVVSHTPETLFIYPDISDDDVTAISSRKLLEMDRLSGVECYGAIRSHAVDVHFLLVHYISAQA